MKSINLILLFRLVSVTLPYLVMILIFFTSSKVYGSSTSMDQDTTLFELVKGTTPAYIVLAEDEQPGVMAAALDLQRDITKITGVTPNIVHSLNQAGPHCVVIGSADNPKGKILLESVGMKVNDLEGKWEVFKYQILDNVNGKEKVLAIAGSNLRGTIFGIYDFEHKHLGVDPLWFWADNEPPHQGQLVFDSSINYNSLKEPTWKYRGWTLNDHPQLIEWMQTGIVQRARYGRYMFAIHPEVFDRIYEAALRLKMNMFTWYFIDIDWKPDWQQLERQVDRGLFLTQHQMEGLGADAGFWDHYWDNHNPEGKPDQFSYIKYPEKFKEFWSYYITRLSEFSPNVVWELNQRGWADAQYYDPALPNGGTRKQRGQLVSEIITEQAKLVRKIDPNPDLEMMTTLYHEMGDYYDSGWINLPQDVTTGFADDGMNGMSYSDKFWTEKRDPNRKYGQYFHTNYFGGGPQIAKATPLDTYIKVNMDAMYERGDTQHMLLAMNVLRPQQMELRGIAEMLWDYPGFDYEEYLLKYCREEFGEEASARVANLYREYYDKYPHKMRNDGYKEYPYYYKVMESLFNTIANLINIEAGSTDGLIFDKYYNREKYQEGIVEMKKVLDHAWEIRPSIPDQRKYFFDYEFIDAIRLIRGIYKLTVNTEDAINYLKEGNRSAALSSLNDAKHLVDEMYDAFENQKSTDKWKYWFRSGTNKDFYLLYNMYQKARLSLEVETMNAVTEISPQRRPYRGNVVMHDVTKAGDAVYEAQGDRLNRSQWDGAKYSIIDFPLTKAFQITGVQGLYGKEKWLEIGTDYGSHYGFNLRSKAKVYVAYQKGEDLPWLKDMGFKPTGQSMTVGEWGWPYRYQNRSSDSLYVLQLYAKDFESGPVVLGKNPESKDLLPYIVFVQPSLIMYENFRDTEIGEQPSDWMIEESTGRVEVVDIVEYDGEMRPTVFDITTVPRYQTLDLRGLKLESSTEEGCGAKYFFEEMVNGDFVLDVRLKTGQIDHLSEIILLNQDEKPSTSIQFDNRGKIVVLSPDGKKVELSSYRANEWYNIKLRVQSSRGKFWMEVQDGDLQQSKSEIMNFNPRKGGMKGIQLNHSKGRDGAWILYNGLSGYVE